MQVYPSSAPNAYGSPSYPGWVANTVYAIENNLATYGDSSLPTYYQRIAVMSDRDNIVTGFASWKGYADPGTVFGAAFANELGNRATYGVHILGNGTKIRLSNLVWNMHSSDPANSLAYIGSFSGLNYQDLGGRALGIDYGPDGVKGGGDDIRIATGPASQLVDEIVFAGRGNAYDAYCPGCTTTSQFHAAIDASRSTYTSIMPFDQTTDYILYDDSHNPLASGSGTTFYGSTSNPPNLSLTKAHIGNMIQGDPGTALGTVTLGPVDNSQGAPGTSAPGFGPSAWQASALGASSKAEVYLTPAQLFGHPVTVADIASISWWTNKTSGAADWYAQIYTVPQGAGDSKPWYRSRLTSEPYLSGGSYTPGAWTPWSTGDATHPLRFFDSNRNGGALGSYSDPTLSSVTSGPINWAAIYGAGVTWNYTAEQILYFSMQTGTPWADGFTGLLDGLTVTLATGEVATVNFEAYTNTYLITVRNASEAGVGPTDGTMVTVTDTLPEGLTATAFYGLGWTSDLASLTATRTDILGPGQSYPPLILKVSVAPTTAPSVTNLAALSWSWGGTPYTGTGSDPTIVKQIPTHLAFTVQPSNTQPDAILTPPVVVEVQDAGNHAVADFSGNITLNLLGGHGNATLTGGGTTPTVSGVATFSGLSVDKMALDYALGASAPYGAGTLTGTSDLFKITNRTPALTSISPFELAPGQPAFTLSLTGSDFMSGATAYFNGLTMSTTFISSTQLTASIPAASVAVAGTYEVVVKNPPEVLADSSPLPFTVGRPSVVYVNGAWTGLPPGTCPDGAHYIGYDAFAVIQDGVNAVADAGTVYVAAGTYLAEVTLPRPVLLHGAGMDITILMGRKNAGTRNTLTIASGGATVEGFTVTRDGNNAADWAGNYKDQGVIFSPGVSGSTLQYCKLTGNRNAIYINNAQGNAIRNNIIDFNRTGMQFANNISGTVIRENFVTNNWTLGVLFNFDGALPNATTGVTIANNNISGNWYSQVECRWTNSTATLDLSGNYLGSSTLVVRNTNATEPGYAAQIPVEYGGAATNPGGAASVGGATWGRMDYTPWLNGGADTDPGTIGFQGDFSYLNVGAASPQYGSLGRIAEGIGLVATGGTVQLENGTHIEDVVVNKSLTLRGRSQAGTILQPATSAPDPVPGTPWEALTAGATNAILVQANDVTLDDLTVDGDNPGLTSGIVRNGADVDARNGIIINGPLGPFDNFTVHHCTVKNTYLRGIYAYNPARAAINLHHNAVDNIGGDSYYSIGIFSRQATGTVSDNTVSRCPDAISANWSHGLQFLNNIVAECGSGVHTDNSGELSGDVPDLLQGNIVSSGVSFDSSPTYGVWAFSPYRTVSLQGNTVSGVDMGLALYGQGAPAGGATFSGNTVDGQSRAGAKGAFVTTALVGWGAWTNVAATFTGNTIRSCADAIYIEDPNGFTADVAAHNNDLSGNTAYGIHNTAAAATNATCNYWGAASGPAHANNPLGTGVPVSDNVTFSPWSSATPPTYNCDGTIPTHLVFTVQPANTLAGNPIAPAVKVSVYDASNALVSWFSGSVVLAIGSNPSGGVLSGTLTAAAVNGMATFANLSINQVGAGYTLTASATGLTGATSDLFNILCILPTFVSADPMPETPNVAASQTLTLSNPAGSALPASFAFGWDQAFTVKTFSADPDGILGVWQEMRPYAPSFSPTVSYQVIRRSASTAFVDMNGNGSYDSGTDYDVAQSGQTITVSRAVAPGAVEPQNAGYRLILQDSLFTNPDSGTYDIQAVLGSECAGPWTGLASEMMAPPSSPCTPTVAVEDTLRITKSGSELFLNWNAPGPDDCRVGFAVLASTDCSLPAATWQNITGQNLDMDPAATTFRAGLGMNLTYYLVAASGPSGEIGPTGN